MIIFKAEGDEEEDDDLGHLLHRMDSVHFRVRRCKGLLIAPKTDDLAFILTLIELPPCSLSF